MKTSLVWLLAGLFFAAGSVQLRSQVTYETATTSNGFYGIGAFVSSAKVSIQGDARRQENSTKFTGTIMKLFNPKGIQIEITRLDKQLIWSFSDQEKSYTEMTFAGLKKLIEEGKLYQPVPGAESADKEKQESEYEWQTPVVAVKNLGDKQKINNFNCNHYLATVTTIGVHKATGKLDTLLLSAEMFNSITVGKAMLLISDYDKRYVEVLGLNKADNMVMAQALNTYGKEWTRLQQEMKKIEGYPIRTALLMTMTNHATMAAPSAKEEKEESAPPPTDARGALGGLLGKKAKDMIAPKKPAGSEFKKEIFQSTHELKTIAAGDVVAENFEVPAGYKLKKGK